MVFVQPRKLTNEMVIKQEIEMAVIAHAREIENQRKKYVGSENTHIGPNGNRGEYVSGKEARSQYSMTSADSHSFHDSGLGDMTSVAESALSDSKIKKTFLDEDCEDSSEALEHPDLLQSADYRCPCNFCTSTRSSLSQSGSRPGGTFYSSAHQDFLIGGMCGYIPTSDKPKPTANLILPADVSYENLEGNFALETWANTFQTHEHIAIRLSAPKGVDRSSYFSGEAGSVDLGKDERTDIAAERTATSFGLETDDCTEIDAKEAVSLMELETENEPRNPASTTFDVSILRKSFNEGIRNLFTGDQQFANCLINRLEPKFHLIAPLFNGGEILWLLRESAPEDGDPSSRSTQSTSPSNLTAASSWASQSTGNSSKRLRSEQQGDDELEAGPKHKKPIPTPGSGGKAAMPRFMCVFYAKCCITHCKKKNGKRSTTLGYKKIHDMVDNHFKEDHTVVRCQRCYKTFEGDHIDALTYKKNEHQRSCDVRKPLVVDDVIDCDAKIRLKAKLSKFRKWSLATETDMNMKSWVSDNVAAFSGITLSRSELTKKDLATLSFCESELAKWYTIYTVIFPNATIPESPFYDPNITEAVKNQQRVRILFREIADTMAEVRGSPPTANFQGQREWFQDCLDITLSSLASVQQLEGTTTDGLASSATSSPDIRSTILQFIQPSNMSGPTANRIATPSSPILLRMNSQQAQSPSTAQTPSPPASGPSTSNPTRTSGSPAAPVEAGRRDIPSATSTSPGGDARNPRNPYDQTVSSAAQIIEDSPWGLELCSICGGGRTVWNELQDKWEDCLFCYPLQ